jgi:hypothetical protein
MKSSFYRKRLLKPDLDLIKAKYKGLMSTNSEIKNTIDKFHQFQNLSTGIKHIVSI